MVNIKPNHLSTLSSLGTSAAPPAAVGRTASSPRPDAPLPPAPRGWTPNLSFLEPALRVFQPSAAPTSLAKEALASATNVTPAYIHFAPPAGTPTTRGLVFLGGAKVEEEAYAPIAKALAERGVAVALVRSPLDLPFLVPLFGQRVDAAISKLREGNSALPLVIGGHSAGGFVASNLKKKGVDELLLLNARTESRQPRPDVRGVGVFGGQDGLISAQERDATATALPNLSTVVIPKLDHDFAQGLYGAQAGDPTTSSSPQALVDMVADNIVARLGAQ